MNGKGLSDCPYAAERQLAALRANKHSKGMHNPKAKLTNSDVRQLRLLAADGIDIKELSSVFEIHKETVRKIVNRVTWKHL